MRNLKYIIETDTDNSKVVYMTLSRGHNDFTRNATGSNITNNSTLILLPYVKSRDESSDVGISIPNHINKKERIYRGLLNEQRDLEKRKSNIQNRLIEIQNDLDVRREEIRSGRRQDQT